MRGGTREGRDHVASIKVLLDAVEEIRSKFGESPARATGEARSGPALSREDLRLICFEVLSS